MKILDVLHTPILLASKSPRRKQLLSEAGFTDILIKTKDTDESFSSEMDVRLVAPYLAEKKSREALDLLEGNRIMLTADSVVILENKIFNKPENFEEAVSMLQALSGNTHTVITGVCLTDGKKQKVFAGESKVTFAPLSTEEINFYIKQYQPYDKAGSYAVQEWIGHCKISKIEGTFANIMGLPTDLVYAHLLDW